GVDAMFPRCLLAWICFLTGTAAAAEPIAQGKPLDYWTLLLHQSELQVGPGPWMPADDPFADWALRSLDMLGSRGAPALPDLLAWFSERVEQDAAYEVLAGRLARTLGNTGPEARSALPLLLSLRPLDITDASDRERVQLRHAIDNALYRIDRATHAR